MLESNITFLSLSGRAPSHVVYVWKRQASICAHLRRFRAGIEGRISVLFGGRGMKRCCQAEGIERFELLVGAAVFA
jgi:hypothetical protein